MGAVEASEQQERARATWSAGEYDEIVEYIWSVGADLVGRVGVAAADTVLDVACGTGNATIPAAQTGATTTGLDLTPKLLDQGRARAAAAGVEIEFVEGDAEALPFNDASFDVVLSTFGCMFAPSHRAAAAEIARVLKPSGRIGIAAWTPDGRVGQFFRSMGELAPPPPPDFQPPPLWGTREHVTGLFDGTGVDVRFEETAVRFEFESREAAVELYYEKFGPVLMLRAVLEPEGRAEEIKDVLRREFGGDVLAEDGSVAYDGEYLITLGEKTAQR